MSAFPLPQTLVLVTAVAIGSLVACSGEQPPPKPITGQPHRPVKTAEQLENEAAPKNGETQAEANIRGLIRVDGFACDRVTQMVSIEQGGNVTCTVAGASSVSLDTRLT